MIRVNFITMSSVQYLQFKIFNVGGFFKLGENNEIHVLASSVIL